MGDLLMVAASGAGADQGVRRRPRRARRRAHQDARPEGRRGRPGDGPRRGDRRVRRRHGGRDRDGRRGAGGAGGSRRRRDRPRVQEHGPRPGAPAAVARHRHRGRGADRHRRTTDQLEISKAALEKGIADINALPLGGFLYGDQIARPADAARRGERRDRAPRGGRRREGRREPRTTQGVAAGHRGGRRRSWRSPRTRWSPRSAPPWPASRPRWARSGSTGMSALAQGITAARQAPLDAFTSLKDMLKNAMTPQAEQLRLHGQLLSKTLAAGLRSGDPAVRAQAQATAQAIANRLAELVAVGRQGRPGEHEGARRRDPEQDPRGPGRVPGGQEGARREARSGQGLGERGGPGRRRGVLDRRGERRRVDRLQVQRVLRLPGRDAGAGVRRADHGSLLGRRARARGVRAGARRPDPQP